MLCRMGTSFTYGSTFNRGVIRSGILLSLFLSGFIHTLAQREDAQQDRAFEILKERGELVLEFIPRSQVQLKEMNAFLSIDRQTAGGYEAYTTVEGFREFLSYGLQYSLKERWTGRKSATDTVDFPGGWDVYPSHAQYAAYMSRLAEQYPAICRLDTLGTSVGGRPILAMKITDNPGAREPEPAFVYSSTMHGDETTGFITLLRLIDYLCSNYGEDSLVTKLVDGIEIWINPLANPDGTYFGAGEGPILQPKRLNLNNVDLNRNFPGIEGAEHPDRNPYQPETWAQMEFLKKINLAMGANIHDGQELVNYPFDSWKTPHADSAWYISTSREFARLARERAYPRLYMLDQDSGITNGYAWYQVEGSRQDWVNYFRLAREVTIEINREKFQPPEDLPYLWYYTRPSLLRYMEHCLFGIQGSIRDAESGNPMKARVEIAAHDSLNSHIRSDSLSGHFARLIEEGTWDLEISAPGYLPLLVSQVRVIPDQAVRLDLGLEPVPSGIPDRESPKTRPGPGEADSPVVFPNPFRDRTCLYLTLNSPGSCRIHLYDMKGRLLLQEGLVFNTAGRQVVLLDTSRLKRGVYLLEILGPDSRSTQKIIKTE